MINAKEEMEISNEKDAINSSKMLVRDEKKSVEKSKLKCDENGSGGEVLITVPPDGGWGWIVVAASFVANFIVDGILYCYGDFIPSFKKEFDVPVAKLSIPGSLLAGFYLMTGPFVSILTNKFGFQKVVAVGSIFAAIFFAASSLAMNVEFLILSYGILGGIGFGMIYSPSIVIVGYYFEKWRGIATGIAVCGSGIGTFAISPLNTFLLETVQWKKTFLIQAGIILICAICGLMFRPIKPVKVALDESVDDEDVIPEEPLKSKKPITEDVQHSKSTKKPPTAAQVLCINERPLSSETATTRLSKSSQCIDVDGLLNKPDADKQKRLSVPNLEEARSASSEMQKLRSMSQGAIKRKKSLLSGRMSLSPGQSVECMIKSRRGTITQMDALDVILQRDDAFLAGSLNRLSQYKTEDSISYTLTVTRVPVEEKKKPFWKSIIDLFDFSLLLSPSFDLLLLSGLLTMLGYFTPFSYVKDRAEEEGLEKNDISWLLSTIGITNTIGRVISGLVAGLPGMDATFINNVALIIAGLATMVSGLVMTIPFQYAYCAVFGLSTAAFASLRSIMVVDLLGLENLNNAFGILLFVQGFGSALGAPVAGAIRDMTQDYDISFYFSGILIMLSGLVLVPLKTINRWEKRKRNKMTAVKTSQNKN